MKPPAWAGAALFSLAVSASAAPPLDTGLPLWEVGVFGGTATTPAYPGSSGRSSVNLALPFLLYRGEVLRSDQSGIGARLLRSRFAELDVGFALSLPARSKDVAARAGMSDLGSLLEFGPRLKIQLGEAAHSRWRLEMPLRAVMEIKGGVRRQGMAFDPKLVAELGDKAGLWNLEAQLGVLFGDAALNRYFYEVRPVDATAERPAYRAQSGMLLARAGLSGWRRLGPDWRFFGFIRYDNYANAANRDSPLLRQNTGVAAGIGLAWTVRRSAARAHQ